MVAGGAKPILEDNACQRNKHHGITYTHGSTGFARHNTCSGNEASGILVEEFAQPTLADNTCQDNKYDGITYTWSGGGLALNNTCRGNERYGIMLEKAAHPNLEENTCQDNKHHGIAYLDSSTGFAYRNVCDRTENHGIYVGDRTHPTLEYNTGTVSGKGQSTDGTELTALPRRVEELEREGKALRKKVADTDEVEALRRELKALHEKAEEAERSSTDDKPTPQRSPDAPSPRRYILDSYPYDRYRLPNLPGRVDSTPTQIPGTPQFPKNSAEKEAAERDREFYKSLGKSLNDPGTDWGG
jgi:parallel beta-helix repeat protein